MKFCNLKRLIPGILLFTLGIAFYFCIKKYGYNELEILKEKSNNSISEKYMVEEKIEKEIIFVKNNKLEETENNMEPSKRPENTTDTKTEYKTKTTRKTEEIKREESYPVDY